jgi:hypothetical protein
MYDPAGESNPRSITLDASMLTITLTKTLPKYPREINLSFTASDNVCQIQSELSFFVSYFCVYTVTKQMHL